MELNLNIKHSLQNLEKSLDALDNALLKQAKGSRVHSSLAQDLTILSEDRSNLARQLDDAVAKINSLENTNVDVEQRIDNVMVEISQLLSNNLPDQNLGEVK
ncbi:MAG: DUF4164 family protein [Rhizobiales bacterium]|nr:DUF4164 family protein [Hyphomicrobiales bacterium]